MLKMKSACEKCNTATGPQDVAYICSYECTFCEPCAAAMAHVCPNCQGDLVVRPRRFRGPVTVGLEQIRGKLARTAKSVTSRKSG